MCVAPLPPLIVFVLAGVRGGGGGKGGARRMVMLNVYKSTRAGLMTLRDHQMHSTPHRMLSRLHPSGVEDLWLRQRDGAWELWLGWLSVV